MSNRRRAAFVPPTHNEFMTILGGSKPRGGGVQDIRIFRPNVYRRGGGLFSMLKSAAKVAIPFLLKNVLPSVVTGGVGLFDDVSRGKQFKQSMRERGSQAFKDVRKRVASGGGRSSSSRKKRKIAPKKKKGRVGTKTNAAVGIKAMCLIGFN